MKRACGCVPPAASPHSRVPAWWQELAKLGVSWRGSSPAREERVLLKAVGATGKDTTLSRTVQMKYVRPKATPASLSSLRRLDPAAIRAEVEVAGSIPSIASPLTIVSTKVLGLQNRLEDLEPLDAQDATIDSRGPVAFEKMDTTSDGVISRDEFVAWHPSKASPELQTYLAQLSTNELDELLSISHTLERKETQQVLGGEGAARDHALAGALIGHSQRRTVHVLRGCDGGGRNYERAATPGMSAEASRLGAESRERQSRLDDIRIGAELLRSKITKATGGSGYEVGQPMLYGPYRRACRISGIQRHTGLPPAYTVVLTEEGATAFDAKEEELTPRCATPYDTASEASIGGYWSPVKAPKASIGSDMKRIPTESSFVVTMDDPIGAIPQSWDSNVSENVSDAAVKKLGEAREVYQTDMEEMNRWQTAPTQRSEHGNATAHGADSDELLSSHPTFNDLEMLVEDLNQDIAALWSRSRSRRESSSEEEGPGGGHENDEARLQEIRVLGAGQREAEGRRDRLQAQLISARRKKAERRAASEMQIVKSDDGDSEGECLIQGDAPPAEESLRIIHTLDEQEDMNPAHYQSMTHAINHYNDVLETAARQKSRWRASCILTAGIRGQETRRQCRVLLVVATQMSPKARRAAIEARPTPASPREKLPSLKYVKGMVAPAVARLLSEENHDAPSSHLTAGQLNQIILDRPATYEDEEAAYNRYASPAVSSYIEQSQEWPDPVVQETEVEEISLFEMDETSRLQEEEDKVDTNQVQAQGERETEHHAATQIERMRRGHVVRQDILRKHDAATEVQRHVRGHVHRVHRCPIRNGSREVNQDTLKGSGPSDTTVAGVPVDVMSLGNEDREGTESEPDELKAAMLDEAVLGFRQAAVQEALHSVPDAARLFHDDDITSITEQGNSRKGSSIESPEDRATRTRHEIKQEALAEAQRRLEIEDATEQQAHRRTMTRKEIGPQCEALGLGARVRHARHGDGLVDKVTGDERFRVFFDSGEMHRYGPASWAKLTVILATTPLSPPSPSCADATLTARVAIKEEALSAARQHQGIDRGAQLIESLRSTQRDIEVLKGEEAKAKATRFKYEASDEAAKTATECGWPNATQLRAKADGFRAANGRAGRVLSGIRSRMEDLSQEELRIEGILQDPEPQETQQGHPSERHDAATELQRHVRGHVARQGFLRKHNAATEVQRHVRGHVHRVHRCPVRKKHAWQGLGIGSGVQHVKRGEGVVKEIMPDERIRVVFSNGEIFRYGPASWKKLTVIKTPVETLGVTLNSAELQTAINLFEKIDVDADGAINLGDLAATLHHVDASGPVLHMLGPDQDGAVRLEGWLACLLERKKSLGTARFGDFLASVGTDIQLTRKVPSLGTNGDLLQRPPPAATPPGGASPYASDSDSSEDEGAKPQRSTGSPTPHHRGSKGQVNPEALAFAVQEAQPAHGMQFLSPLGCLDGLPHERQIEAMGLINAMRRNAVHEKRLGLSSDGRLHVQQICRISPPAHHDAMMSHLEPWPKDDGVTYEQWHGFLLQLRGEVGPQGMADFLHGMSGEAEWERVVHCALRLFRRWRFKLVTKEVWAATDTNGDELVSQEEFLAATEADRVRFLMEGDGDRAVRKKKTASSLASPKKSPNKTPVGNSCPVS